jgi:hypothetical protein
MKIKVPQNHPKDISMGRASKKKQIRHQDCRNRLKTKEVMAFLVISETSFLLYCFKLDYKTITVIAK